MAELGAAFNAVENEVAEANEGAAANANVGANEGANEVANEVANEGANEGANEVANEGANEGANEVANEVEIHVYNPIQYNYLWYTSWSFLLTTCYTVYLQKYNFVIFPGTIFVTSLNYWRNPRYNTWERTLDVGCVYSSVAYNIFRSFGAEYAYPFYVYILVGLLCYILSNYNHRQKRLYMSSFFHSLVHVFGNVAVIYLYSGYIYDTWDNPITQGVRNVLENMVD
jgi:hypothetical protein